MVLESFAGDHDREDAKISLYQFAFRNKYQAGEVLFILRSLVEKTNEWQTFLPGHVFILDGDIQRTYDKTTHHIVIRN